MKLYLVGSAIWSILHEAASRGPSALAYILVPCCIAYPCSESVIEKRSSVEQTMPDIIKILLSVTIILTFFIMKMFKNEKC